MKSLVSMTLCLLFVDLARSAGHDVPKITANGPINIARSPTPSAILKCHVEQLSDSIAWIYNDTTYFSCDPPYSAGTCVQGLGSPYDFSINEKENMFMVKFPVEENVNDGNWTCRYGNDTSHPYDLDTGKPPSITTFTASNMNPSEGDNVTFTCTVSMSDAKLTQFKIQTSDGTTSGYPINIEDPTNVTYTVTNMVDCKIITYSCCVSNHYGVACMTLPRVTVNCPVKLLTDLTTTNVTTYEGDREEELKLFYTGVPQPQFNWYRLESGMEVNLTDYRLSKTTGDHCIPHGTACSFMIVFNPIVADSGYYVVHVNASGMVESHTFHLNVLPAKSASSIITESPSEQMPCQAASTEEFTFGQGIGIGIGIGLGVIVFIAGGIYGCRKA